MLLYGVNQDAPEHAAAHRFLEAIGQTADPRVPHRRDRLDNVQVLRATDRHWELLRVVLQAVSHPSGNLFFDVRTVVLMREHGIRRIYTTDTDFLQFDDIEVTNPLRSA